MGVRILVLAVAAAAAGCGGGTSDGDAGGADPGASTRLAIEIRPSGPGGPFAQHTLQCDPPAGSIPDAAGACEKLDELGDSIFAPLPDDVACTDIYGGPQIATVSGTLDGEAVSTRFTRTDGCQIERWDRAEFLLPEDDGT